MHWSDRIACCIVRIERKSWSHLYREGESSKGGKDLHADATQDKAWAIDLYLVKHSGMGRAAVLVGVPKSRLGGSVYPCCRFSSHYPAIFGWSEFTINKSALFLARQRFERRGGSCDKKHIVSERV